MVLASGRLLWCNPSGASTQRSMSPSLISCHSPNSHIHHWAERIDHDQTIIVRVVAVLCARGRGSVDHRHRRRRRARALFSLKLQRVSAASAASMMAGAVMPFPTTDL